MKKRLIVDHKYLDVIKEIQGLLSFTLIKDRYFKLFNFHILTFKKEESNLLQIKYRIHNHVPFFLLVIPVLIAIVFITLFMIFNVAKLSDFQTAFLSFMLPGAICILISVFISIYKFFMEVKNIKIFADIESIRKDAKNEGR